MDLIRRKLFKVELEDGDRLKPKCYLDETVIEDLRKPWRDALIVQLLGKSIGFFAMRNRLDRMWKLAGNFDMVDIGHGYYMIKFDLLADREKVIGGGPWMVFDHCLAVQLWKPNFIASHEQVKKTIVWIRFPSLGMEYYDESVLLALASTVG